MEGAWVWLVLILFNAAGVDLVVIRVDDILKVSHVVLLKNGSVSEKENVGRGCSGPASQT
jgi:hypothetical protein